MSDFFGKLKQTIDKSAKVITAKSSSAIDVTKVKSEISSLNKAKTDLFLKVGKKVYETSPQDFSLNVINEELISLAKCDADIAAKEQELERIKQETDDKLIQINQTYADSPKETKLAPDDVYEIESETEDNSDDN